MKVWTCEGHAQTSDMACDLHLAFSTSFLSMLPFIKHMLYAGHYGKCTTDTISFNVHKDIPLLQMRTKAQMSHSHYVAESGTETRSMCLRSPPPLVTMTPMLNLLDKWPNKAERACTQSNEHESFLIRTWQKFSKFRNSISTSIMFVICTYLFHSHSLLNSFHQNNSIFLLYFKRKHFTLSWPMPFAVIKF